MKTTEFIKKVEALGYEVECGKILLTVKKKGLCVLEIDLEEEFFFDSDFEDFDNLPWSQKKELMSIVCEFMLTDPAEREEEKRYWLRLVTPPILKKQVTEYLRKSEYLEYYTTGLSKNTGDEKIKTIFTESEIDHMDITGFEKEEVTP